MVRAGDVVRASDVAVQACRLTHSVGQTIAEDAALAAVTFDTELADTDGMHSSGSPTRITIQTAGWYLIGFSGQLAADTDYQRLLARIRLNGSTELSSNQNPGTTVSAPQTLETSTVSLLSVGDYVEVMVFQAEAGTQTHTLEALAERSPIFYAARFGS